MHGTPGESLTLVSHAMGALQKRPTARHPNKIIRACVFIRAPPGHRADFLQAMMHLMAGALIQVGTRASS